MIIREIASDPFGVVANFDWFNDYDDTKRWILSTEYRHRKLIRNLLDAGFILWSQQKHDETLDRMRKT